MAKLPPIKRFVLDDFTGITTIAAFCTKLFYPLNLFLNATYSALANGITLAANTLGLVNYSSPVTTNADGAATTTINWPYPQSPPVGVAILACTLSGDPATYPLMSWSYNAGVITISLQFVEMSGGAVVASGEETYAITFWVSGG